jgi:hypothetical protein
MKVGSYVICVDDSFSAEQMSKLSRIPKKDDYYTIREIVEYPKYNRIGVRLEEISNPPIEMEGGMHEPTFNIFRFAELNVPPSLEAEIENLISTEVEINEL